MLIKQVHEDPNLAAIRAKIASAARNRVRLEPLAQIVRVADPHLAFAEQHTYPLKVRWPARN